MAKMKNDGLEMTVMILLIVGAINWGLMIWGWDLVSLIFRVSWLINIIYAVVALAGIYKLVMMFQK
jgi:uncharacterized membrane protein YuzA (DUF378 family)